MEIWNIFKSAPLKSVAIYSEHRTVNSAECIKKVDFMFHSVIDFWFHKVELLRSGRQQMYIFS